MGVDCGGDGELMWELTEEEMVSSCGSSFSFETRDKIKVKSSMARSLPVENLLPQKVGSIINYFQ